MREIKLKVNRHSGKTLMEALLEEGVQLGGTCGGRGTCGKCKASVNGQDVLACKHKVTEDVIVTVDDGGENVTVKTVTIQLPEGFSADQAEEGSYGIAIDLGTTTVVVMLWNLHTGELVDVEAVSNPQRFYGADVISRISFALRAPWNLKRLQSCLVNEVNQTISKLTIRYDIALGQIRKIAVVGNTVMSHLFLGEDVRGLAAHPFTPAFTGSVKAAARELGLAAHEEAEVYIGPNMAGHVGSDITAGVLAWGSLQKGGSRMLLDIGTNGEIFLETEDKTYCCSTAAGPAFEGGALHQGMRGAEGAISGVSVKDGIVHTDVIGGGPAKGICGSGIIDALAVMIETGAMDHFGTMEKPFVLSKENENCDAVTVIQADVREVQMAKAAIAAGCSILLQEGGTTLEKLEEIGIAGAFGSAIHIDRAIRIGLLPKAEVSKFRTLGNAAGLGAAMMLLSEPCRKKAENIAESVEHVELAALTEFQSRYIEEMNF